MECFICGKETTKVYLCEQHAKELYAMLVSNQGKVEEPKFLNHCNICGEYEGRVIIEQSDICYVCDEDITEAYKFYGKNVSMRDAILDSLADDGESVIQIEQYLNYLGVLYDRACVKGSIIDLLGKGVICICYPVGSDMIDIETSDEQGIEEYWFELTEAGKVEQERIVFD